MWTTELTDSSASWRAVTTNHWIILLKNQIFRLFYEYPEAEEPQRRRLFSKPSNQNLIFVPHWNKKKKNEDSSFASRRNILPLTTHTTFSFVFVICSISPDAWKRFLCLMPNKRLTLVFFFFFFFKFNLFFLSGEDASRMKRKARKKKNCVLIPLCGRHVLFWK